MAPKKRVRRGDLALQQAEAVAAAATDMSSDPDFPDIQFTSITMKGKFVLFKRRPIVPTRFIDRQSMRELGLDQVTLELFEGVGMKMMYGIHERTYVRLTWEFLSSLRLDKHRQTQKVAFLHFRLMNKDYSLTLPTFASHFGLDTSPPHKAPETFDHGALWKAITGLDDVKGVKRAANTVHNAAIRIWHRYMGWTIFGREENHNFRTEELEILGSYLRSNPTTFKIDIAHHLALTLQRLSNSPASNTAVVVGGLITHLMKRLNRRVNLSGLRSMIGDTMLFKNYIHHNLGWLKTNPNDGLDYWQIRVDGVDRNSIPLPNPGKMKVVPNQEYYLLEIEDLEDPSIPQQINPNLRYARGRPIIPARSTLRYATPSTPFVPGPLQQGEGSSSQYQQQSPPLHADLISFMEDMKLNMANAASERLGLQNRLDRIYYDHSLGQFPVYDDMMRHQYKHPSGLHPSYYLFPDGGHPDDGTIRYGDINLRPDYFSAPVFPTPPSTQGEGQDARWFGGTPSIFTQGGSSGAGGSSEAFIGMSSGVGEFGSDVLLNTDDFIRGSEFGGSHFDGDGNDDDGNDDDGDDDGDGDGDDDYE